MLSSTTTTTHYRTPTKREEETGFLWALVSVSVSGHVSVALAASFPVAGSSRRHTSAAVAACHAGPHARSLPRMQRAPLITQWNAICPKNVPPNKPIKQ